VRRKWPLRYAPVDRNRSRMAADCGLTKVHYSGAGLFVAWTAGCEGPQAGQPECSRWPTPAA
jgi:hypothetical protein